MQTIFVSALLVVALTMPCPLPSQHDVIRTRVSDRKLVTLASFKNMQAEESSDRPASAPHPRQSAKEEAWAILEAAYEGNKTSDRAMAVRVLGLTRNDVRATRLAETALKDDQADVRAAAVSALGEMKSKTSIPKLKAALDDDDPVVALSAAHSLDLMHDRSAYRVYYEVLTGQRKAGRGVIASKSSTLKDPKKVAQLGFEEGIGFVPFASIGWAAIRMIAKDDASAVRAAAAKVLANDPDPDALTALTDALGDNSWLVRAAALDALVKRGNPAVLPQVQSLMSDEREAVKLPAAAATLRLMSISSSLQRQRKQGNSSLGQGLH